MSRHQRKKDLSKPDSGKRSVALICAVLAAVTLAAYWPVLGYDFVDFDDNVYVTENQHVLKGLTLDGVKYAFSITEADNTSNWHPLTWLSHMLDCELFGQNAGLHHLTNLLIHTASAVVLLLVLVSMTGRTWSSAFVAAAFALHPLHVESVAWIAERKDVLSGFFWFLTMACYLRYTRASGKGNYILALVVFALGLMAKPMLVTLPFVLLLLDYWPLNRFELKPAVSRLRTVRPFVVEKIPFFVLSAASCVVTYVAQKAGESVATMDYMPLRTRLANAAVSYVAYISKTVRPVGLAVFYPLKDVLLWQAILAFFVLAVVTVAALLLIRRKRYFAVGWLWYVGTLVPVVGLVQVGNQRLADRYTYIPLIGLFMIAAWAVGDLCRRRPALRVVSGLTAMLLLAGMLAGTQNQLSYWKDSIPLFRRAIQVTENNSSIHYNLGRVLIGRGQPDEAINHYRRALQIDPDNAKTHSDLGAALTITGQLDEAINHCHRALQIDPAHVKAQSNLGVVFTITGQLDEAINHYRRALQIDPDHAKAHSNLGLVLTMTGQLDEAINHCRRALQIDPDDAKAHFLLGAALFETGQGDEAIHHYYQAHKLKPEDPLIINNLAWIMATASDPMLRNPAQAVRLAEKACELTGHENKVFLVTLTAAYASADRLDDAVSTGEKALKRAIAAGDENLEKEIRANLKFFKER